MGHLRFVVFYLVCGLIAAGTHILMDPSSPIPTVGASGAIAGILGAYLVLYPKVRVNMLFFFVIIIRIIPLPAWVVLAYWFLVQLISGWSQLTPLRPEVSGGVAFRAHIGGFLAGIALIKLFEDRRRVAARTRRDVDPPDSVGKRRELVRAPRLGDRVDAHRAPVAVVLDPERRRRLRAHETDRRPEPDDRRQQRLPVGRRATRDDPRGHAHAVECPRAVVRRSADVRRLARQQVARQVADERDHARASMDLLVVARRASAARTNASAKLGRDAPICESSGWSFARKSLQKPSPCVCASHS